MTYFQTPSPAARTASTLANHPLTALLLTGVATALLLFVPWFSPLVYPFRLLMTLVHELGHGLAALLTGGSFRNFVVFPDGAGVAYTAGGWRFLVIPAGYIGTALFGAALILLGRSQRASRAALLVIGGAMLLLTLRYGVPTMFTAHPVSGLVTVASGVVLGGALVWLARRASTLWCQIVLYFVALQAALSTWTDLATLIGVSTQIGAPANDARSMAELTFIPALVWALLWALLAAALIGGAAWRTWGRGLRGRA